MLGAVKAMGMALPAHPSCLATTGREAASPCGLRHAPGNRPSCSRGPSHRLAAPCWQTRSQRADSSEAPPSAEQQQQQQAAEDLACYGNGSEVECLFPEGGPSAGSDGGGGSALPLPGGLAAVGEALILVSPFFFWGTSMVAMKELAPHTTPLLVAAWRLIPSGAALLAWAQLSGRRQPTEAMGWLAVALFGLVDGACFQVRRRRRGGTRDRGTGALHRAVAEPAARAALPERRRGLLGARLHATALPQGFLAEGLQRTSAGLGSVIIDSQPLTVALLASLLFGERLGAAGVAGLGVGILGLCLLEVPPSVLASLPEVLQAGEWGRGAAGSGAPPKSISAGKPAACALMRMHPAAGVGQLAAGGGGGDGSWSLWDSGEWWMLLAAQSMAVGTVMVRWVAKYCDPVVATGWHMVLGGLPLLALSLAQEGGELPARLAELTGARGGGEGAGMGERERQGARPAPPQRLPSGPQSSPRCYHPHALHAVLAGSDVALLLYVSLLGSAASYGVFFYKASQGSLTALSSLTFLTPMFAAAGGYLALGETLSPLQLTGAAVTLGAVALINKKS